MTKPHALFATLSLPGHFFPAVNLSVKLAGKGFVVTVATLDVGSSSSSSSLDLFAAAAACCQGLDIRFQVLKDAMYLRARAVQSGSHNDDIFYALLHHALLAPMEELLQKLLKQEPPVTVLIADTFNTWPSAMAKKYDLLHVSFWTQTALVLALHYHKDLLISNGHFATLDQNRKDTTIRYIPGIPEIEPHELLPIYQSKDASSLLHQFMFKCFDELRGADFVLANTVEELEAEPISALRREMPFYAIGPIFPDGFAGGIASSISTVQDCTHWLDTMPAASVLYVSFGTLVHVSERDLREIAHGVLNSKVNFLWVRRPGTAPLPDGFVAASEGRGMVVPWCHQKDVLLHPSVGGFLTHCGWNSTLESVWCGVPMLCFPLAFDQLPNCKLVSKDLKIGVRLGGSEEVNRDEVCDKIEKLMGGEVGAEVRMEMDKVQKAARAGVASNGSSSRNMDKFIDDLLKHLSEKDIRISSNNSVI
ncbi:LOW QUALITY PROTEIN: UDP-glycosyltransferase 86A1-like [Curcuma longa]|uniref:LOW QUALITY PROTEIN: UDP-glycosyltransferase 86A1-like n=1 Tax=Curcuma longa TaxID=136217 RepID=UPI003D9F2DB1